MILLAIRLNQKVSTIWQRKNMKPYASSPDTVFLRKNSLLFSYWPAGVNTPKWRSCPAVRQLEWGWNRDCKYFRCLTLNADFMKFFCASSPPGRKPSSEGKEGREIKQLFHTERSYLLVSLPTDPSSILITYPRNSRALWSLTSALKTLCSLASLAVFTQVPEKLPGMRYLAVLIGTIKAVEVPLHPVVFLLQVLL